MPIEMHWLFTLQNIGTERFLYLFRSLPSGIILKVNHSFDQKYTTYTKAR